MEMQESEQNIQYMFNRSVSISEVHVIEIFSDGYDILQSLKCSSLPMNAEGTMNVR
jgi:hypothetical protein